MAKDVRNFSYGHHLRSPSIFVPRLSSKNKPHNRAMGFLPNAGCQPIRYSPDRPISTRKAAPRSTFGQSERVSGGGRQLQGATGPQSGGDSRLLWLCWSISAHGSPFASGWLTIRSCQATATGGPRKRSIRRRIAANTVRGTATSASWNTRWRLWRTIRAPIFTSFSRNVVSDHCDHLVRYRQCA